MAAALAMCLGVGYLVLRAVERQRRRQLRPVHGVVLGVLGLRTATWVAHCLSALGVRFHHVLWVSTALGVAGWLLLARDLVVRTTSARFRDWWQSLAALSPFLVLGAAAWCAPPTAWDLYTHWLTLPHEIVGMDSLLSLNTLTNSVAPSYALHQSFLGASLIALGVPDGRLNALSTVFVAGTCVVLATTLVLLRPPTATRRTTALLSAALLCTSSLVFGFFYGDALFILSMAMAGLGLVLLERSGNSNGSLVLAALVTTPVIGKGYGHPIALATCAALIVLGAMALRHPSKRFARARLRAGSWGLAILFAERYALYALTVHPHESNEDLRLSSIGDGLRGLTLESVPQLLGRFMGGRDRALLVLFVAMTLALFALAFQLRQTSSRIKLTWMLPGIILWGVLFVSVFSQPSISGSLPRYSFGLVPCVALGAAELLAQLGRRLPGVARVTQGLFVALAAALLAFGDVSEFFKYYLPASPATLMATTGEDPEAGDFRPDLLSLARKRPGIVSRASSYLLLNEEPDGFLQFRVMSHLSACGYWGRLFGETHTSRSSDRGARVTSAREALKNNDVAALREALRDIDLVILNVSKHRFPDQRRRVLLTDEFLELAQASLAPAAAVPN